MRRIHLERWRARRELKEHRTRERLEQFTCGLKWGTAASTACARIEVPSAVVGEWECARAVFLRAPQPGVRPLYAADVIGVST